MHLLKKLKFLFVIFSQEWFVLKLPYDFCLYWEEAFLCAKHIYIIHWLPLDNSQIFCHLYITIYVYPGILFCFVFMHSFLIAAFSDFIFLVIVILQVTSIQDFFFVVVLYIFYWIQLLEFHILSDVACAYHTFFTHFAIRPTVLRNCIV